METAGFSRDRTLYRPSTLMTDLNLNINSVINQQIATRVFATRLVELGIEGESSKIEKFTIFERFGDMGSIYSRVLNSLHGEKRHSVSNHIPNTQYFQE